MLTPAQRLPITFQGEPKLRGGGGGGRERKASIHMTWPAHFLHPYSSHAAPETSQNIPLSRLHVPARTPA